MASSKTGQLDKDFLANANVIPLTTTRTQNRGESGLGAYEKLGRFDRFTGGHPAKGNVTHNVTAPGTPVSAK